MKKVKLKLTGIDGNAFALMAAFQRAARKQGWTQAEIDVVINKCMEGDYDNLGAVVVVKVGTQRPKQ